MGDITKVNPEIDPGWLALIAGGHNGFQLSTLSMSHIFAWAYRLRSDQKAEQRIPNAHLAKRMLVKSSPDYAGEIPGWWALVYPGMMNFLDSLRQTTNVGFDNEI